MSDPSSFDFFIGRWTVHHRYLARRLAGCEDWIEFPGTCETQKFLGGLGVFDQNEIDRPEGRYIGVTIRTFDPKTGSWSIYWIDSRTPAEISPPMIGRFENGVGTLYGDDTFNGKPIRVRFIWSGITARSARWEQAFSVDEGNTWETNWYMDFTRL